MIGMSWASQSNVGGGRNVQLPAYAALAILFGLGLAEALRRLQPVVVHGLAYRRDVLAMEVVAPDLGAVVELQGAFGGTGSPEGSTWEDAYGYEHVGSLFPDDDVYWAWRRGWTPKVDDVCRRTG